MGDAKKQLYLPPEILQQIFSYNLVQRDVQACTLVSRSWWLAGIETLYRHPTLSSKNFDLFVRTICPSINPGIKRTYLSTFVKTLDMGMLGYDSSHSLTARLLGRVKHHLEVFVSPQTSFS
jgi:hypothetical protein